MEETEVRKKGVMDWYAVEAAIPAIVLGSLFLMGSATMVMLYGTPWESKEKADATAALFNEQITQTTEHLKETAQLLADLRTEFAKEKQHQEDREVEEERRFQALENEHPRR